MPISQTKANSPAESELRAQFDRWAAAVVAKDADGLVSHCAADAVLYDVKPPYRAVGLHAIRKVWTDCLPYFPDVAEVLSHDVVIEAGADLAFSHRMVRFRPVDPASPAGSTWIRVTSCHRREGDQWVAAHEHVSLPYDPTTGQVVPITDADLAPQTAP